MPRETGTAPRIGSDSLAQREAEKVALSIVAAELGLAHVETQKRFSIGSAAAIVAASASTVTLAISNSFVGFMTTLPRLSPS